jgi:hypothetical protein
LYRQHTGRRRLFDRKAAVLLLAPALVGSIALAIGAPAQAASTGPASNRSAGSATQKYSAGTYIVQLAERPVATYSKTAPARGERLNTRQRNVHDYVGHLDQQRDRVLGKVGGVKPLYTYRYVLNGFAAKLTADQASRLAHTPGVTSLVRNKAQHVTTWPTTETGSAAHTTANVHNANTTRAIAKTATTTATTHLATTTAHKAARTGTLPTPDTAKFLGLKDKGGLYSKIPGGQRNAGEGLIIGVLDTGIDTSNPSLKPLSEPRPDAAVIAKKWKGGCDPGQSDAPKVVCNNKVIGAQYFRGGLSQPTKRDWNSPMDAEAHGTHTATTAAGDEDVAASVPDTAISGRISGIAPAARIAAYKVCWSSGCWASDVVAGYDKAVADGVDVINYSVGGDPTDSVTIPQYMAMLNAAKAGVFVSASAGNSGPGTASNSVPWVTSVAASTHDVGYRTTVTLGNGSSYTGVGVNTSALPSAPLVNGAKAAKSGVPADQAKLCKPDTINPAKAKEAIVLCARGDNSRLDKSAQVKAAGGIGMVLYNTKPTDEEVGDAHTIPSVHIDSAAGKAVTAYADSSGASAKLSAARTVHQESPQIAGFSSGGLGNNDLISPDITAPGVDIVAGTTPGGENGAFKGNEGLMSGTSMASPHLAGLALLVRSMHPDWSPAEVRSALMTTATTTTKAHKPIRRSGSDHPATPVDFGAGQVVPNAAVDPGLVYNATSADWTSYICALGQTPVTSDGSDPCAIARKIDPSDLNNPTIAAGDLVDSKTITRTVTNVSDTPGVYTATLDAPSGFKAEISPRKLTVAPGGSATYRVTFTRTDAPFGDWSYGSVTLKDEQNHTVRSAAALRAAQIGTTAEATGKGTSSSVTLTPRIGWKGTLANRVNGLYPDTTRTGTLTGADPDFDPAKPKTSGATVKTQVTVPEGTTLARLATLSDEYKTGSDIDLWVFDKSGTPIGNPDMGADEHVNITKPGTYDVYISQYAAPHGTTSQKFTLHTWLIGDGAKPEHPATVAPASQAVRPGDTPDVTVSWHGLPTGAGKTYLGLVDYSDGTDIIGRTMVTVIP